MKFKLDENFDIKLTHLFVENGHDVETVYSERLSGESDDIIYQICLQEQRAIISFDLDFANPFRFPPSPTEGIIIFRPKRLLFGLVKLTVLNLLKILRTESPKGKLWIIEPTHFRIYDPNE